MMPIHLKRKIRKLIISFSTLIASSDIDNVVLQNRFLKDWGPFCNMGFFLFALPLKLKRMKLNFRGAMGSSNIG